jgi:site-specific DNA-methyltransferase (adenine-specific)
LYDKGNRIQTDIINDFIDREEYDKWIKKILLQTKEHSNEYNSIYVFGNGESLQNLYSLKELYISNMLVWVKNNFVLGRQDYKGQHEFCLYGWFNKHKFYGGNSCSSVLKFDKPLSSKLHPTMKPIEMLSYLIRNSSKERDIILDMFGGSGSTLIACEQTNRICYMMEIDPSYCSVILERWENLTNKKAIKI